MADNGSGRRRFDAGDPLRAIAALSVLTYHAFLLAEPGGRPSPTDFPRYGTIPWHAAIVLNGGLFIFFVLSGYLLGRPFVRAFLNATPSPRVGPYLRNRIVRIVPAFWTVLTVLILLGKATGTSFGGGAATYLFAQTFHSGTPLSSQVSQGWTLGVEMAFYFGLPLAAFILTIGSRRLIAAGSRRTVLWLLISVGFAVSLWAHTKLVGDGGWAKALPAYLFAFMPGLALAAVEDLARDRLPRMRFAAALPSACLVLAGVAFAVYSRTAEFTSVSSSSLRAVFAAAIGSAAVVAAALMRQWNGAATWRALDNPVTRWLGARSYSIYLIHFAVMLELRSSSLMPAGRWERLAFLFTATLAITLVLSDVLHRLVERPALRWRARPTAAESAHPPLAPRPDARHPEIAVPETKL